MAQAAEKVLEFPSGGIADFYMEDHEIEALEREEAAQEFGSSGIATFEPVANRMASYGRYGDDTVAHVETGELIVPKALIDDNPKLRDSIFSHLRDLGVEDPERYVVGSGVNSINPDTGMPEFFLKKIFRGVKKAASKVVKGVSKALKGVTKVIKKAAPVIIPFALNAAFPGLGAIYSGALGAGIGTLVQGGNLKDAFKNALIGGAIGGATAAIGGGLQAAKAGTGTFGQGAMKGIQDAAKFSNLQTAGQQLATGQFGQAGLDAVQMSPDAFAEYSPDKLVGEVAKEATTLPPVTTDAALNASKPPLDPSYKPFAGPNKGAYEAIANNPNLSSTEKMIQLNNLTKTDPAALLNPTGNVNLSGAPVEPTGVIDTLKGYGETAMDYGGKAMDFLTGKPEAGALNQIEIDAYNKAIAAGAPESLATQQAARAVAEATPGIIRTFGPTAALAGAGLYAAGGLDKGDDGPSDEELLEQLGPTGYELYKANEAKYGVAGSTPMLSQGQYSVPTTFAADGGEIFPRRVGGIMPDEGTPGKDSVKAMLMPGEFVMTTNAVKGLGDGDNDKGINRMYDMMRGLEAKGKAMA
jgi:hypothetical protein